MHCMFLIRNYFPVYYMRLLIHLELSNIGIPKIIASYVLEKEDWEPILRFIEDGDIDMYILEEDFCTDKIQKKKERFIYITSTGKSLSNCAQAHHNQDQNPTGICWALQTQGNLF